MGLGDIHDKKNKVHDMAISQNRHMTLEYPKATWGMDKLVTVDITIS